MFVMITETWAPHVYHDNRNMRMSCLPWYHEHESISCLTVLNMSTIRSSCLCHHGNHEMSKYMYMTLNCLYQNHGCNKLTQEGASHPYACFLTLGFKDFMHNICVLFKTISLVWPQVQKTPKPRRASIVYRLVSSTFISAILTTQQIYVQKQKRDSLRVYKKERKLWGLCVVWKW